MHLMQTPPIDLTALRRALVIKLRHHGDVLLAASAELPPESAA